MSLSHCDCSFLPAAFTQVLFCCGPALQMKNERVAEPRNGRCEKKEEQTEPTQCAGRTYTCFLPCSLASKHTHTHSAWLVVCVFGMHETICNRANYFHIVLNYFELSRPAGKQTHETSFWVTPTEFVSFQTPSLFFECCKQPSRSINVLFCIFFLNIKMLSNWKDYTVQPMKTEANRILYFTGVSALNRTYNALCLIFFSCYSQWFFYC